VLPDRLELLRAGRHVLRTNGILLRTGGVLLRSRARVLRSGGKRLCPRTRDARAPGEELRRSPRAGARVGRITSVQQPCATLHGLAAERRHR
jgi:hypothetical protein